jgi:hypothetical protein
MSLSFEPCFYDNFNSIKDKKVFTLIKSKDGLFEGLKKFLEELKNSFSWIDFEIKEGNFSKIEYNDMHFYGLPKGHLLTYFIKFAALPEKKAFASGFEQRLFVSSMCPNCPKALDLIIKFLGEYKIKTHVYYLDDDFSYAEKYNVKSVPCLVIEKKKNEIQRFVGDLNKDDLKIFFEDKNKDELTADYFKNIIEQGKAEEIADMICLEKKVFPGFVSLFKNSPIGLRVGAVVTAEYLRDKSCILYEELLDMVYEIYTKSPVEIKGDILYLLSLSCEKDKWIKEFEKIEKNETNELIKEIISDSLETLNT